MTNHFQNRPFLGAAPTVSTRGPLSESTTLSALTESERFTQPRPGRSHEFEPLLTFAINEVRDWLYAHSNDLDILPDLLELASRMNPNEWLTLLGEFWLGLRQIGSHHGQLALAISNCCTNPQGVIPEMMDGSERAALDTLPDTIVIYRGCGPVNKSGCSWTLDRWIAEKVPFMEDYVADHPLLLSANLPKHRIAALKLGRVGREVIAFGLSEEAWTEEEIAPPPTAWV